MVKKLINKSMLGTVVKVDKVGSRYVAIDKDNNDLTSYIYPPARNKAFTNGNALMVAETNTGKLFWKAVSIDEYEDKTVSVLIQILALNLFNKARKRKYNSSGAHWVRNNFNYSNFINKLESLYVNPNYKFKPIVIK